MKAFIILSFFVLQISICLGFRVGKGGGGGGGDTIKIDPPKC